MANLGEQPFEYNEQNEQNTEPSVSREACKLVPKSFINSNFIRVKDISFEAEAQYTKDKTRIMGLPMKGLKIGAIIKKKTQMLQNTKNIDGKTLQEITDSLGILLNEFGIELSVKIQQLLKEYNYNENIRQRFSSEVFQIVKQQINYKYSNDSLSEDCQNFAETLNLNRLFLNNQIKKQDNQSKERLRQSIVNNQIYKVLFQYGENIYVLQYNFVFAFFQEFFEKLNIKVFKSILEQLINNPYYMWTDRDDLNPIQMKDLIKSLWLDINNPLTDLKRAHKYSETSKRKKELDIRKIQDLLIIEKRFDFNRQQLDEIIQALNQYNFDKFFDEIKYIKYQRPAIYSFIQKNCLHYLNAKNQEECIIQITQDYRMILREKLYEMCYEDKFYIKNWNKIETDIMFDRICKIQKYFQEKEYYYQLKHWVQQKFSSYYQKVFPPKLLKDSVKRELISCFIGLSATQKYKESVELVQLMLEAPYLEVIKSSDLLSGNKVKILISKLENSALFKEYNSMYKEDSQHYSCKAKSQIQKIIDSENFQLTIKQKSLLSDVFFKKPRASSIYQFQNICNNYKKQIFKSLNQSQEILDYIASHQRGTRIQKIIKVKIQLQNYIKDGNDFENVLDYFLTNGEIIFANDEKLTVQIEPQYSDILTNLMNKMTLQDRKNLKKLQQNKNFRDLKDDLPEISKIYFIESKVRLKYTIKGFINKNDSLVTDNKLSLEKILFDIIEKGNIKQIDEDSRLKDSNFQQIIAQIKNSIKFKLFSINVNSKQSKKAKYAQITLKNKIKSMYDHEQFISFSSEEKKRIINLFVQNLDLNRLVELDFLNKSDKQYITNFIQKSQEFKLFEESKRPSNHSSSQKNIKDSSSNNKIAKNNNKRPPPSFRSSEKKIQVEPLSEQKIEVNPESSNKKDQTNEIESQFYSPRIIDEISQVVIQQNIQNRAVIQKIIKKWEERLISWEKYEKSALRKEKQGHQQFEQFTTKLLYAHPWTNDSLSFFKVQTKAFLKNKIAGDLKEICQKYNNDIQEDLKILRGN